MVAPGAVPDDVGRGPHKEVHACINSERFGIVGPSVIPGRIRRQPRLGNVRQLLVEPRATWAVYSWLSVSPEQEQQVCDALVNLGWLEDDHALHAEGVRVIGELLVCSTDDAKGVLHDLRSRKLIDVTITPDVALDTRKSMGLAQLRWVRPRG